MYLYRRFKIFPLLKLLRKYQVRIFVPYFRFVYKVKNDNKHLTVITLYE